MEKKVKMTRAEKKAIKKAKKAELKAKGESFWSDFKKFIAKGNIIDMAVGVVIGSAFSAIITNFVNGVINPLIGLLTGNVKLSDLSIVLREAVMEGETIKADALTLNYGLFLQKILDFLIIAFCIFLAVRIIRGIKVRIAVTAEKIASLAKKEENAEEVAEEIVEEQPAPAEPVPAPAPVKTTEERIEELLIEIRDSLTKKESKKKSKE